jgi:hypothetical protein
MNNILLNWKYMRKGIPNDRKLAVDRIPQKTEMKIIKCSKYETKTHRTDNVLIWDQDG